MTLTPDTVRAVAFDKAPLGHRGYDEAQVDAFLDLVEAALAGSGGLAADDVDAVRFDPGPWLRRGYDERQVDAFLDLVATQFADTESGEFQR